MAKDKYECCSEGTSKGLDTSSAAVLAESAARQPL